MTIGQAVKQIQCWSQFRRMHLPVGGAAALCGVLLLSASVALAQSEEPPAQSKPIGQRGAFDEPARSNPPDLDQLRNPKPIPPPPAQNPPPKPGPHPAPPDDYYYWPDYPTIGVSYNSAYYYAPLTGVYSPIDPNLVIHPPRDRATEEARPRTAGELLHVGSYQEAGELLRGELDENPGDVERMRYLAVVEAAQRQFENAAALIEEVYLLDPEIAWFPLDGDALFDSPLELRRLVVGAVRHAQRTGDARAWLLVAVLMQAEGRDDVAFKMLGRAADLGLDERIVQAWPAP